MACVTGDGLESITTNVDYPPVLRKVVVTDEETDYLLKSVFNRQAAGFTPDFYTNISKSSNPCFAHPKVIYRGEEQILVLVEQLARKKVPTKSRFPDM